MTVDRAGDGLVAAVPEYVHYVVLELLKNAMRATMQTHGGGGGNGGVDAAAAATEMDVAGEEDARVQQREGCGDDGGGGGGDDDAGRQRRAPIVFADVPAVNISVKTYGAEDVMLVVADKGGGIPADATDKVRDGARYMRRKKKHGKKTMQTLKKKSPELPVAQLQQFRMFCRSAYSSCHFRNTRCGKGRVCLTKLACSARRRRFFFVWGYTRRGAGSFARLGRRATQSLRKGGSSGVCRGFAPNMALIAVGVSILTARRMVP